MYVCMYISIKKINCCRKKYHVFGQLSPFSIAALDPAGPLWSYDREKLAASDAQYVEVMHTNTGLAGYTDPLGDADFYPNGGNSMPGCITNSCDHGRAIDYFASTVKHNHLLANQCETYREVTRNRCSGERSPMGNTELDKPL
jgi:pancreatic triacylglycerol lipase